MSIRHKLTFLFIMLLAAALWQMGLAGWIHAKALTAQLLLDRAWQQTLRDHKPVKPWPWADTWPVAELIVPKFALTQIVLAGDDGATLAFGPGHAFASALPGEQGTVMISGHRDTHFHFLQGLKPGDRLILKTKSAIKHYKVSTLQIVDSRSFKLDNTTDELVLVTCFPFNSLASGGSERYLVFAEPEKIGGIQGVRLVDFLKSTSLTP